jgi:hypothetical protein
MRNWKWSLLLLPLLVGSCLEPQGPERPQDVAVLEVLSSDELVIDGEVRQRGETKDAYRTEGVEESSYHLPPGRHHIRVSRHPFGSIEGWVELKAGHLYYPAARARYGPDLEAAAFYLWDRDTQEVVLGSNELAPPIN